MNLRALPVVLLAACGSASGAKTPTAEPMDRQTEMMMSAMAMTSDDAAVYAPLGAGADYATYVKMNTQPVTSETHGGRLVDTYVNAVGAAAYFDDEAAIPVGTVVVKTSMQVKAGQATGEAGPIFVMEKLAEGAASDRGDWSYAIHWGDPPAAWRTRLGGPIYWRSPSPRVNYCFECHENYDRFLGGVPGSAKIPALP